MIIYIYFTNILKITAKYYFLNILNDKDIYFFKYRSSKNK